MDIGHSKHNAPSFRESDVHLDSHDHIWSPTPRKTAIGRFANLYFKMFATLLMCSTMTIPTTRRIMFTVSAERDEQERKAPPSPSSPLRMPNKLAICSRSYKNPSRPSTLALLKWAATQAGVAAAAVATVVAVAIVEVVVVVAVAVASLLPTPRLWAAVDGDCSGRMLLTHQSAQSVMLISHPHHWARRPGSWELDKLWVSFCCNWDITFTSSNG